jgi:hypothetical protein
VDPDPESEMGSHNRIQGQVKEENVEQNLRFSKIVINFLN